MFKGYLSLGGTEIANAARTETYITKNAPGIPLRNCYDCGDLVVALGDGVYESPIVDDAPWFDPNITATNRFYGLYPLSIEGIEDSTRSASVIESIVDGGSVGAIRFGTRAIRVRGVLLAADEYAMTHGMTWLRNALDPAPCAVHGGSCGGAQLCYYAACPAVCEMYDPTYQAGSTFPIYREDAASSPVIFRESGYDFMWKARINVDDVRKEGLILQWGAVSKDDTSLLVEHHGPVAMKRINYVPNPTFRDGLTNWETSGGGTAEVEVDQSGIPYGEGNYGEAEYGGGVITENVYLQRAGGSPTALGPNVAPNSSFEDAVPGVTEVRRNLFLYPAPTGAATTGWGSAGSTGINFAVVDIEPWFEGGPTTAVQATSTNDGTYMDGRFNGSGAMAPVIPGRTYSFGLWAEWSISGPIVTFVQWFRVDSSVISTIQNVDGSVEAGVPRGFKAENLVAPPEAAFAYFIVRNVSDGTVPAGTVVRMTAGQQELATFTGDWFSGNTPDTDGFDYSWVGPVGASASVAKADVVEVRRNVCTNPGIEVDTANWVILGGANIARDVAVKHSGSASLRVTTGGAISDGAWWQAIGTLPNTVSSGGAWVMAPLGAELYIGVRTTGAAGVQLSQVTTPFTGTGDWQFVKAENAAHPDATGVVLMIRANTAHTPFTFWIDDVFVELAPTLGTPFNGDSPATGDFIYSWTGTQYASASVERAVRVSGWAPSLSAPQGAFYRGMDGSGVLVHRGSNYSIIQGATSLPYTTPKVTYLLDIEAITDATITTWAAFGDAVPARVFGPNQVFTAGERRMVRVVADNNGLGAAGVINVSLGWHSPVPAVGLFRSLKVHAAAVVEGEYNGPWFESGNTVFTRTTDMPVYAGETSISFNAWYPEGGEKPVVIARLRATDDDAILTEGSFDITETPTRYSLGSEFGGICYLEFETAGVVNIDQVLVEAGHVILPYFDGSTPVDVAMEGYLTGEVDPEYAISWLGLPDKSESQALWLGELSIGAPVAQWAGSNDGLCDAYPMMDIMQGTVTGTMSLAVRLPIPIERQVAPLERTMHDVTCIEGPTIISERVLDSGAVMREVEFLLIAGRPSPYGPTELVLDNKMVNLPTMPWIDTDCTVAEPAPIIDPDCPPVPSPPRPPSIPNLCVTPETTWQRYWLEIPSESVSAWSATSPQIIITSGSTEIRQVRVRAYPNPFDRTEADMDPCAFCSEFIVSYLPAQTTLTVDAILERAFASVAGADPVTANHLLYSGDGSPMTWPELTCGMGYYIAIDVPELLLDDVTVQVTLTNKE